MSEYQYYEFQALERPLSTADRAELRNLSSRARITARSFTNTYQWGDFKGDPAKLMERWFDLHLYQANWGTRRLMIRLPARLIDHRLLEHVVDQMDSASLRHSGDHVILDIKRDEVRDEYLAEEDDDDSAILAALAPLRDDLLAGDLRVAYLLWLMAIEEEAIEPDEVEPLAGLGPLTPQLEAFAEFFAINDDLVQAAAERDAQLAVASGSADAARGFVAALTDHEKTVLLVRLAEGDPHVAAELRATIREHVAAGKGATPTGTRTAGELTARAAEIAGARARAVAERRAADEKQRADVDAKIRRFRLDALARRGEGVWQEIESEIDRSNAAGYDKVAALLHDLHALAIERGTLPDFTQRLAKIRERHARKARFLERLVGFGDLPGVIGL